MAEVWVRLPLGALVSGRRKAWPFRVPRLHEIVGSNPAVLTEQHDAVGPVLVRVDGC